MALAAAGVEPDDVDTILLTHAHVDHVGGLTLHGKPIFTKAEVMVSETEAKFWRDDAIMASAGKDAEPFFLAARTALDAYAPSLKLIAAGEVLPGITLVPLPGHTPGHSGYHVVSGGEQLLIWADITHLADVQIRKPEVTIGLRRRPRPGARHPHEGVRPGRDRPLGRRRHAPEHAGLPHGRASG